MISIISIHKLKPMLTWDAEFRKTVVRIALPVSAQALLASLVSIVDSWMVASLGETSLAAVAQASAVTFLFTLTSFGLSGATSLFVAQFWGSRDERGIRMTMGISLYAALAVALLFALPSFFAPRAMVSIFLRSPEAIDLGSQYLRIMAIGYLFQSVSIVYATVQRSTEQVKVALFGSLAAISVNCVLNYILIYGKLGAPALGVRGAAIATVIALVVEMIILIAVGNVLRLATAVPFASLFKIERAFAKRFFMMGYPVVLNEFLWAMGVKLYNVVYGMMDSTTTAAAVSIFVTFEQLFAVALRGMTQACAVIVGKFIGEGNYEAAQLGAKRIMFMSSIVLQMCGFLMMGVAPYLVRLFDASALAQSYAAQLMMISGGLMWMTAVLTLLIVGVFRAGGDVVFSAWLDAGPVWVIGLPLTVLGGLVLRLPIPLVYLMARTEVFAKIAIGLWRFRSRKWINNVVKQ